VPADGPRFPGLAVVSDTSPADWLADRLWPRQGKQTQVGAMVPDVYLACGRLLHPARSALPDGPDVIRWSQIAAARGLAIDSRVRFRELAGWRDGPDPPPSLAAPLDGSLDEEECLALADVRRAGSGLRLLLRSMDNEQARARLLAERAEVEGLLRDTERAGQQDREAEVEAATGDIEDAAQPLTAEGLDDSIADTLRERLAALDRALLRLDDGTYGRSVRSGVPIPEERLEADPAAELTIEEARARP
jgi:DnaK suppressor protein